MIQFAGKALGTLIAFAALTQLFRYLGPIEYGKFHIILTFVQLSGIIGDFGLYLTVLKDVSLARYNPSHIISQHFMLRLYLNFVYLLTMALVAAVVPYGLALKWGILVMSFSNTFIWFGQIFQTLFQKKLITQYTALSEIIGRGVLFIATMAMIYANAGLVLMSLTVVMGNFGSFFFSWFFARKHVRFTWRVDKAYIRNVIERTWPVAVSIWFSVLYFKADTILLSFFKSDYEVGIYGMPYRILETLVTLPLVFMGVLMPVLSKTYSSKDERRFKKNMQRGFDALSLMSVPLVFGTLPLSRQIVMLLAGPDFKDSVPVLKILMLGVFVIFIGSLFGHAVVTVGKQKAMIKYYALIASVMLIAYILLIPPYSYWAAAWLTVVGEGMVFFTAYFVVWKKTRFIPRLTVFGKSLISAIIMAGVVHFIRNWSLFFTLPVAFAVYGVVLYIVGGIRKDFLLELVNSKNNDSGKS